jgi:outer membrane murein-binding lipoprotein Lpp
MSEIDELRQAVQALNLAIFQLDNKVRNLEANIKKAGQSPLPKAHRLSA